MSTKAYFHCWIESRKTVYYRFMCFPYFPSNLLFLKLESAFNGHFYTILRTKSQLHSDGIAVYTWLVMKISAVPTIFRKKFFGKWKIEWNILNQTNICKQEKMIDGNWLAYSRIYDISIIYATIKCNCSISPFTLRRLPIELSNHYSISNHMLEATSNDCLLILHAPQQSAPWFMLQIVKNLIKAQTIQ